MKKKNNNEIEWKKVRKERKPIDTKTCIINILSHDLQSFPYMKNIIFQ